jgi:hypothetical protein
VKGRGRGRSDSESCPVTGSGIRGVEPSDSIVMSVVSCWEAGAEYSERIFKSVSQKLIVSLCY